MKKKLMILFFIGVSVSIFFGCFPTEHYQIKDFEFFGIEEVKPGDADYGKISFVQVNDTLKNGLYLRVFSNAEYQYGYLNNISLIDRCYATTVPRVVDNTILLEEMELKLNCDIYWETETIEKGTDLWNHPKLKEYKWFSEFVGYADFSFDIGFEGAFYEKAFIPQQNYTIEMTCKTDDGLVITKSIDIYLKLATGSE